MTEIHRTPIGIYTYEDDLPGIQSYEVDNNKVTRLARKAMEFAEELDDSIPGVGDVWQWTVDKTGWIPGL